jgi:hypothetical protein
MNILYITENRETGSKDKEWCSQANVFWWVNDENGITLEYFNLKTNAV